MNPSSFFRSILVLLAFILIQLPAPDIRAQDVQVAFDAVSDTSTDASVFTITRDLRSQLGLFPEHPGFENANLYRQAPGRYALEISVIEEGRTSRVTSILDSAQVAELRSDIRSRLIRDQPSALVDQSGRSHFLWTTAAMSFLYYGPALAANVGGGSGAITTSYLLGGGAGFFIPYLLTQHSKMTDGMAAGARVGAILGIVHTALAFGAVDAIDDVDGTTFTGVSAIVSAAELTAGTILANKYNVGAGRANLIGVGGVFGTSIGADASVMILGENSISSSGSPALMTGAGLIGSLGGMYWANEVALRTKYTTGDAKAVMMGGLTGTLVTTAILTELVGEKVGDVGVRLLAGMFAAGTLGGCYATHQWLGRRNFGDGDGNLVILGTVVGGLIGVGIVNLENDPGTEAILIPAATTALGFSIMMATLGKGTEDRGMLESYDNDRYGDAGVVDKERHTSLLQRMEFSVNPLAIGMAATNMDVPQGKSLRVNSVPIAALSLKL